MRPEAQVHDVVEGLVEEFGDLVIITGCKAARPRKLSPGQRQAIRVPAAGRATHQSLQPARSKMAKPHSGDLLGANSAPADQVTYHDWITDPEKLQVLRPAEIPDDGYAFSEPPYDPFQRRRGEKESSSVPESSSGTALGPHTHHQREEQ